MKIILRIARTELAVLFYSPIAWFILIVFTFLSAMGYVDLITKWTTSLELGHYANSTISITGSIFGGDYGYFQEILGDLYIYIPLLTMGLMSREYSSGSIKLLLSSPITSTEIILGKYLATLLYSVVLLSIPIIGTLISGIFIPEYDLSMALTGLLGLYFLSASYCAIGLFMSNLTSYQVVAAIGTLVMLAALSFIGNIGQEYQLIRDITYWLSISGRAMQMINGLICSEDVLYFFIIISMFISLAIMKLSLGRSAISGWRAAIRYVVVILIPLFLGYFTSLPSFKVYYDSPDSKPNTITKNSQEILSQLDGEIVITHYVNLMDRFSVNHFPNRVKNDEELFSSFVRFKPDIKLKYVYYLGDTGEDFSRLKGDTFYEKAEYLSAIYKLNMDIFLSPDEIAKKIDLRGEGNIFVRIIEDENGNKSYLRDFADNIRVPTEAEISAAFKKLTAVIPVVGFISGQGERANNKYGDRDYSSFAQNKYFRYALTNQGFNVKTINLSEVSEIPEDINIIVIADSKAGYSDAKLATIDRYIARGGNLFILAETFRQNSMNPLLSRFGLKLKDGILAQPIGDFAPNLILSKATEDAGKLTFGFAEIFQNKSRISMPGATAIEILSNDNFKNKPILVTNKKGAWIELETTDLIEDVVEINPLVGELEAEYATATSSSRQINGKEQRVIVVGDADCISNKELSISREGYKSANYSLITESFRWLSDGKFPIDVRRPEPKDNKLNLTADLIPHIKILFMGIFPSIMIFICIFIWAKRRKN